MHALQSTQTFQQWVSAAAWAHNSFCSFKNFSLREPLWFSAMCNFSLKHSLDRSSLQYFFFEWMWQKQEQLPTLSLAWKKSPHVAILNLMRPWKVTSNNPSVTPSHKFSHEQFSLLASMCYCLPNKSLKHSCTICNAFQQAEKMGDRWPMHTDGKPSVDKSVIHSYQLAESRQKLPSSFYSSLLYMLFSWVLGKCFLWQME